MTNKEEIVRQVAYIGSITDDGATLFATDFGLDPDAEADASAVSAAIDRFLSDTAFRSSSISENGFSISMSNGQIRQLVRLKLLKYGITPNEDTKTMLGVSTIRDATKRW